VLHRIQTALCLDDRLFWAMILWSWCGPQVSPEGLVVLKDEKGFIRCDRNGKVTPATLKDLKTLLGLSSAMAGHITRAAQRLERNNCVRFDGRKIYPEREPTYQDDPKLTVQSIWHVGSKTACTDNLPEDPIDRTRAIDWLENACTAWKTDLRELRTKHDQLFVQAIPSLGLVFKEKSLREEIHSSCAGTR
jgi:hypothetical protein